MSKKDRTLVSMICLKFMDGVLGFRCTFVFTANGSRKECPVLSCKHAMLRPAVFHTQTPNWILLNVFDQANESADQIDQSTDQTSRGMFFCDMEIIFSSVPVFEDLVRAVGRVFLVF